MDIARPFGRRDVLVGLASAGLASASQPALAIQPLPETLATAAHDLIAANDVPGLGFGIVRHGQVASVTAFGFADRERRTPVTPNTAFLISSISKVVTGAALMQLQERRGFSLDEAIGPYLDFAVDNPRHAGPITFRQLLTHTSSISDSAYNGFIGDGDPTLALRDFLIGYLTPGGRWYEPEKCYLDAAPGERWSYSNVASALAGYLCERIEGNSLKHQTEERIFLPLAMKPASWSLAELGRSPIATPYDGVPGQLKPCPPVGYPDWPAGLLRTSTTAITRFLAAHAGGGRLGNVRLLQSATVSAMVDLKPFTTMDGKSRAQGLFWETLGGDDTEIVGKIGADRGSHCMIGFHVASGAGAAILTNRSPSGDLGKAMQNLIRQAVFLNG